MSAVGAVVCLVLAGVHDEGDAAEEGTDAASDEGAPHEGGVAVLEVYHCGDVHFAAGTVD